MTKDDKISLVDALIGEDQTAIYPLVEVYLADAESAIMRRLFPYGLPIGATMPSEYEMLQCKLAARYWFRRGAEGETSHSENGVNRSYGSVNDEDLLSEIVSYGKVM